MLGALFLPQEAKLSLVDYFTSGVVGGVAAVTLLVGSFFLVAWLAHRVGFGA